MTAGAALSLMARVIATIAPAIPTTIAPFDPGVYSPSTPLPAGMRPMTFEERGGQRWRCAGEHDCMPARETFAGWFGTAGPIDRHVRVELHALPPSAARTDRAWARRVREATHDIEHRHVSFHQASGAVQMWRGPHGRVAQSEIQYGGREADPVWKLSRHEERDGWTLHLEIRFFGFADEATRAALRAAFVDGPLGAPPPTAKIVSGLF